MRGTSWQDQAWAEFKRLGQFSDIATDDMFADLREWAALVEDERAEAWASVQAKHGARITSLSTEQIDALADEERVALLAAITMNASATASSVTVTSGMASFTASRGGIDVSSAAGNTNASNMTGIGIEPLATGTAVTSTSVTVEPGATVETPAEVPEPQPLAADGVPPVDPPVDAPAITADGDLGDNRWHAIVLVEGVRTNDGRRMSVGGISTRPLTLPLQYTTETTYGHDGAVLGGTIDSLIRDPNLAARLAEGGFVSLEEGAQLLVAEGDYDEGDAGQELRRLVNAQRLRFVSADLEILEYEEVLQPGGDPGNYADWDILVTRGNVMGATACPFPAFQQCVIAPMSMDLFEAATQGIGQAAEPTVPVAEPVAVAAGAGPQTPPAEWFQNPRFGADDTVDRRLVEDPDHPGRFYCPYTETQDGRIFGHAAAWHRDHIGFAHRQVRPPHSGADYAYFATGTIEVEGGDIIRCGPITLDTGHAPLSGSHASAAATKRHYDDSGTAIADIEVGEDEHGIWYSGAIRSTATEEQLRALRATALSGDWRPINGHSELVALLCVNTPGFPLPRPRRSYRVDGDDVQELALVAAGFVPPRDPIQDQIHREVAAQLAPLRTALALLTPLALEAQAAPLTAQ